MEVDGAKAARESVVVYTNDPSREAEHERVTHLELARRLARLQGLEFCGEYDPSARYPGRLYFVPAEAVVGVEAARQMGIESEQDLFGGVVPQPFIATKSITHPLIDPRAHIPQGWSARFPQRVSDAVLAGFTTFTLADAQEAARRLLERGPVRVKAARANAGRGQWQVVDSRELSRALETLDETEVAEYGLVIEEHLEEVRTYSVGQVRVGALVASYYGTQRLTTDNQGATVYGGSDLAVTRGGFDALLAQELPDQIQLAIRQARTYDAAADACFAGFIASRRNYDIAQGLDARGQRRSGVLEQSWRIGGASSAELMALEALQSDMAPPLVQATSLEIYGRQQEPPPQASVLFSGEDAQIGPILKCAMVKPYDRH